MKYYGCKSLLQRQIPTGTELWACAFEEISDKKGFKLFQMPVKGILVSAEYADSYEKDTNKPPKYFVPYGKNGELLWSKCVSLSARSYATSEKECEEMFKELISRCIAWHDARIFALQKFLKEESNEN